MRNINEIEMELKQIKAAPPDGVKGFVVALWKKPQFRLMLVPLLWWLKGIANGAAFYSPTGLLHVGEHTGLLLNIIWPLHLVAQIGAAVFWGEAEQKAVGWGVFTVEVLFLIFGWRLFWWTIYDYLSLTLAEVIGVIVIAVLASNLFVKLSRHTHPIIKFVRGIYG